MYEYDTPLKTLVTDLADPAKVRDAAYDLLNNPSHREDITEGVRVKVLKALRGHTDAAASRSTHLLGNVKAGKFTDPRELVTALATMSMGPNISAAVDDFYSTASAEELTHSDAVADELAQITLNQTVDRLNREAVQRRAVDASTSLAFVKINVVSNSQEIADAVATSVAYFMESQVSPQTGVVISYENDDPTQKVTPAASAEQARERLQGYAPLLGVVYVNGNEDSYITRDFTEHNAFASETSTRYIVKAAELIPLLGS